MSNDWPGALRSLTKEAGLDGIASGAYVNLGHSDTVAACGLVHGGLTTFARLSVMYGKANGPVSAGDRAVLEELRGNYGMRAHTRGDSRQAGTLTDDFVDRFAIVDPPVTLHRAPQIACRLGLDKVAISGGTRGASTGDSAVGRQLIAHVLPVWGRLLAFFQRE